MSFWPINFRLPDELDDLIGESANERQLVRRRDEILGGDLLPPESPRRSMDPKSLWLASGVAALASLLGAGSAPLALRRFLASSQEKLDQEYAAQARRDASLYSSQREQRDRALDQISSDLKASRDRSRDSLDRADRARLRESNLAAQRRREQLESTWRKEDQARKDSQRAEEWKRDDALRREDLLRKEKETAEDRARWERIQARLDGDQALREAAQEARDLIAHERNQLARERQEITRQKLASQKPASPSKDVNLELQLEADRRSAVSGQKTRYFIPKPSRYRDAKGEIKSFWRAIPTAAGKVAQQRLADQSSRLGSVAPLPIGKGGAADPRLHPWAFGARLRPINSPPKKTKK